MICSGCALYEPDELNPAGGLGDCPVNRTNPRQVAILHKNVKQKDGRLKNELHYHSKLIFPNMAGCSQWQGKPEGKQE